MCKQALSGQFDPDACPLLQGLSPEQQIWRLRNDPLIRACIAAHNLVSPIEPTSSAPAKKPRKRRAPVKLPLSCQNPASPT